MHTFGSDTTARRMVQEIVNDQMVRRRQLGIDKRRRIHSGRWWLTCRVYIKKCTK